MKNTRKGFTLVELVIVIAVIAILAGVLIATFASVIKRANDSAEVQNIKNAEIAQKADDIIKKIENSNWFGWEDFETSIVAKITTEIKNSSTKTLTATEVENIVKDALSTWKAQGTDTTDLTAEQVRAIVENAIGTLKYEGVTEAQVRAIVNAATATTLGNSLSAAQVKAIVTTANENNLTAAQVAAVLVDKLSGVATLSQLETKTDAIKTALSGSVEVLSGKIDDLQALIETTTVADSDAIVLAKSYNVLVAKYGVTSSNAKTPYDVLDKAKIDNVVSGDSTATILLSLDDVKFIVVNKDTGKVLYNGGLSLTLGDTPADEYKYWTFDNPTTLPITLTKYSTYLTGTSYDTVTATGVGVDVGNAIVSAINYNGVGVAHDVVIRTNNANTTLTIDAPLDTVNHYDVIGKVDAQRIDLNHCYNEFGKAAYIKLTEGKVVAKDGGEIAIIFANNTDSSKVAVAKENNGTIKKGLTTVEVVDANNFANYAVHLEYSADGINPYTAETIEAIGELSVASETGVQPQGMDYTAVVNNVGYNSLHEAIAAANAGDTVSLLKDVTDNTSKGTTAYYSLGSKSLTAALIIDKNITINGFNHTFRTTCNSGMAINVSNITVNLNDIVIITTSDSAIYFGQDIANTTLNVEGSKLQAKSYTVRSGNGSNHLSLNFKDTTIEGWSAFTIRSSHSTINLTDCDLWGENDAAPHPSNDYATIVFDGADYSTSGYTSTSPYDGNPGQCGSNNVMRIVNTKVGATSLTSNGQQWLSLQYGPRGNSIIVDSLSILSYATSINCTSEAESSSNTVKVGNNTIIPGN